MRGHSHLGILCVALLAAYALSISACAPDREAATPAALGPFAAEETVTVGDISLELASVVEGEPDWMALGERHLTVTLREPTLAGEGRRYVDATIRLEDLGADPDPNAPLPSHGDPYVVADGSRIPVGDMAVESNSDESPANRLVAEFSVPDEAQDVVLFLPLGEQDTQEVSFRLR